MPRGMGERFEGPSDEVEEEDTVADEETTTETSEESEGLSGETAATEDRSDQQRTTSTTDTDSSTSEAGKTDDEPLNIREDWDSATIYVEPEQSEDIEITFTRLKKQLNARTSRWRKKALLPWVFRGGVRRAPGGNEGEDSRTRQTRRRSVSH